MKGKKLWAILLTICLVAGSIGVTSVMASDDTDIDISIVVKNETHPDNETNLQAGDVINVAVNLDKFKSTLAGDDYKAITTIQMKLPYNGEVFEYVDKSMTNGLLKVSNPITGALTNSSVIGNVISVVPMGLDVGDGALEETDTTQTIFSFKLKVKSDVSVASDEVLDFSQMILKNLYVESDELYSYSIVPAELKVCTNPVITVDGSETVAAAYTNAVTVAATEGSVITVNNEEKTNPCTVSAKGSYTVVATNEVGLTDTETFEIAPVVNSVSIKTAPAKTEYVKGTALDVTGGVITAFLSNGETEDIPMTADMCSGFDSSKVGEQTVTVTYEGKPASFTVNVKDKEVTAIAWNVKPADTIIEGQDLSTALKNAKITVTYDSTETESVSVTETMCSGFDSSKVGVQTVTVTYGGKTLTFDITVNAKSITGITVKSAPEKTEYIEGTAFDVTGGVITVSYDNGKSEDIPMTETMCSGFDNTVYGQQTITVTYEGKTAAFDVNVKQKSMTGIEVTTLPSETEVLEGKDLNVTDGEITVTYDNGTTKTVNMTADMITGFDSSRVGTQMVTVSYTESGVTKTTELEVNVKAKSVLKVELISVPVNTKVLEGKELDLTGAAIRVVYNNDTEDASVPVTQDMISDFDNRTIGTQNIKVTYQGMDADKTFEVTVIEKSISKVEITKNTITEIKEGKPFAFDGEITVSYDNGDTDKVAMSDASVKVDSSAVNMSKPGTYTVSVVYTDKKNQTHAMSYEVKVAEKILDRIAITKKPSKTSIIEGTKLDVTDGIITAYYDNGTEVEVPMTDDMISNFDNTKVGEQTATVTYNGKTAELQITVASKQVVDVTLVSAPTAAIVTEGLELELTGGKIHVTYDNGTEEDLDMTQGMLTLDNATVGKQTATITFGGKSVTFEVEVIAKVATGISTNFESVEVKEGTALEKLGLEVYLVYNNGTKDELALSDVTITGYDASKLGKQNLTVSYQLEDKLMTIEVSVTVLAEETTQAPQETTTSQETTTVPQETTTGGSTVPTGDASNVAAILAMVVAAGTGFVIVSRRREQR